jgi:glycosyltransferase involved in cell wall biosynthesis
MPTEASCPRISIVTASFNQARFLPETIESVLGQNYPNLEYIIMDGGSTDGSAEIIRRYEKHLKFWRSEPDDGQAAAINEGFSHATGDILAWLNSDDFHLPGTLKFAAENLDVSRPELLFGNCFHFVDGANKAMGSQVDDKHRRLNLELIDYLIQPSTFWTQKLWSEVGPLESQWGYAFDWEWFIRAKRTASAFKPSTRYLSAYRIHAQHKSSSGGDKRFQEIRQVYAKYQPERIVQLVDLCRKNYAAFSKIRRRSGIYQLAKFMEGEKLLKQLHPVALKDVAPEEIRDVMDMIAP